MPTPESILANLTLIANDAVAVAIAWHGVTLAAILALALGWVPSRRMAGVLLVVPIATTGIVAFAYGNPFNGGLFSALALALAGIAARLDSRPVQRGGDVAAVAGIVMIAFGWLYPHFLGSGPAAFYLVAAPTGIIPCPTLSLVTGFTLLSGGLSSRSWSLVVVVAGAFYGVFGVARLGVHLDLVLVGGAIALLIVAVRSFGWAPVLARSRFVQRKL